jgi:protein-tyrosine phosphatase
VCSFVALFFSQIKKKRKVYLFFQKRVPLKEKKMQPTRRQLTHLLYEMLPGMYIGGWQAAEFACRTKVLGPRTYVVNLANGKPMFSPLGVRVKVNDDLKAVSLSIMGRAIGAVVSAMRVAMEQGLPVIVHCHAGRQRSAAVIAAYIMKYEGLDLNQTIKYMKTKKPDVFLHNVNFLPVLKQFELALKQDSSTQV